MMGKKQLKKFSISKLSETNRVDKVRNLKKSQQISASRIDIFSIRTWNVEMKQIKFNGQALYKHIVQGFSSAG